MPVDLIALGALVVAVNQVGVAIVQPKMERMYNERADKRDREKDLQSQFGWFKINLEMLERVIRNADKKELEEAGGSWLKELKKAIYDADDLLDEHRTWDAVAKMIEEEYGTRALRGWNGKVSMLTRLFSFNDHRWAHYKMNSSDLAENIYKFNEFFSFAVKTGKKLPFWEEAQKGGYQKPPLREEKDEKKDHDYFNTHLVGRTDEINQIKKILSIYDVAAATQPASVTVSIILIRGPVGIGKSFLARHVYCLPEVNTHFDKNRVWVRASDCDKKLKLLNCMVEEFWKLGKGDSHNNAPIPSTTNLNILQGSMEELVKQRKILLVLDDMWIEESEDWVSMLASLGKSAGKGSCIIITTRINGVSRAIESLCSGNNITKTDVLLGGMSTPDILQVLMNRSGVESKKTLYEKLTSTRALADITQRCNGWPLAADSVGGSLTEGSFRDWIEYSRKFNFTIADDKAILRVVELSYERLSPASKLCLPILSLFPRNFQLQKEEVVALWIAHNFIQSETKNGVLRRIEVIGKDRLSDMVKSSILDLDKDHNVYSMHDVYHQLAVSISDDYLHLTDNCDGREKTAEHIRHLSFSGDMASYSKQDVYIKMITSGKLRTLMFLPSIHPVESNFHKTLKRMLHNLELLRVLVLKYCPIKSLPKSIGYLKHLRYLNLSFSSLEKLPDTIGCLFNLIVLDLSNCSKLYRLPNSVTDLVNLRHLYVDWTKITSPVRWMGRLSALQALHKFSIGEQDGHKITEIKTMKEIHGRLEIVNIEKVKTKREAEDALLREKDYLKHIDFKWDKDRTLGNGTSSDEFLKLQEDVLDALEPDGCVRGLSFEGYKGRRPPSWLSTHQNMKLLDTLELVNCSSWETFIPFMAQKEFFTRFCLRQISGTEQIGGRVFYDPAAGAQVFPVLDELVFEDMPKWKEWKGVEEDKRASFLPKLRKLEIIDCPVLSSIPFPLTVQELRLSGVGLQPFAAIYFLALTCLQSLHLERCCSTTNANVTTGIHSSSMSRLIVSPSTNLVVGGHLLPSSLQALTIVGMNELNDNILLSQCLGGLTSIKELFVKDCPNVKVHSADIMRDRPSLNACKINGS